MKHLLLISFFFISSLIYGQKFREYSQNNSYSISLETTLFYENSNDNPDPTIYFMNVEWHKGTRTNHYHFFKFGYGITLFSNNSETEPLARFEYSYGKKIKNHLFDIGMGVVSTPFTYLHLRFGYKLYILDRFIIQAAYTPSLWLVYHEPLYFTGFHGLSIGINYQFQNKFNQQAKGFFNRFQSFQLNIYPFLISPIVHHPAKYSFFFETDYLLFKRGFHRLLWTVGLGSLSRDLSIPLGLSYLYGNKKYFIETGLRYMTSKDNHDNNFNRHHFFQPQIGYRYQFNSPFFARIAYAPYFRMADWKFRDGMEQSVVFGVGYQFHK